jgi:hypothetical protein
MSSLQSITANYVRGAVPSRRAGHDGLTARLALDAQTKEDAYRVRYNSYLGGGFIDPRPDGMFSDADDLLPNSRCVVVYKHGEPVASVRVCTLNPDLGLAGWNDIPAKRIFPEAILRMQESLPPGATFSELNRLVRHPDYANDFELVFVLFRFATYLMARDEIRCSKILSCVRRNHTTFYKRLHFEYVDGPRRYAGVKFETNLMAGDHTRYGQMLSAMPFIDTLAQGEAAYAGFMQGAPVNVFQEG